MADTFSFSDKPILSLLDRIPSVLPGIEKITAIYYDAGSEKINSSSLYKNQREYIRQNSILEDPYHTLDKFRSDSVPYSWIRKEDIDFEISNKEKVQLNIFNELDNNILLVRTINSHDNLSDLIFIHFNRNLSNFGMASDESFLSTENKTIIGHIMRNTVETFLSTIKCDREIFISLMEHQNLVVSELSELKQELAISRVREKEALLQVCRNNAEDLSREHGVRFILSESALAKIREFDGEPRLLKIIIEKAARFARSVSIKEGDDGIMIEDHHIILNIPEKKKEPEEKAPSRDEIPEVPVRYERTFNFLNKLETAAQSVKVRNLLLTSANVGSAFPSPITPAAITDALKNHQSKILYLFKELPHRWQIIRSEFRPVQNILNPRPERQKRTG